MEARGRTLSGGDLISIRSKGGTKAELPEIGTKDFMPDGSWLEGRQLETALEERRDLVADERIEKLSFLSSAEWLPEEKRARVTSKVGKMWESFGYHDDDGDWLLPEEALFLLETNSLELMSGGVRLSIERSYYALLEGGGCTPTEYRVYSYLSRLGYRVVRHSPDVTVTRYERRIRLDRIAEAERRDRPPGTADTAGEPPTEDQTPSGGDEDGDVFIIEDEDEEKGQEPMDDDLIIVEDEDRAGGSVKEELITCSSSSSDTSDSSAEVVCVLGETRRVELWSVFALASNFLASPTQMEGVSSSSSSVGEDGDRQCAAEDDDDDVIDLSRDDSDDGRRPLAPVNLPEFVSLAEHKTRSEILDSLPSAKNGVSRLRRPDSRFIPANICPRYEEYRVNLSVRPQQFGGRGGIGGGGGGGGGFRAGGSGLPFSQQRSARPFVHSSVQFNGAGGSGGGYYRRNRNYILERVSMGGGSERASAGQWRRPDPSPPPPPPLRNVFSPANPNVPPLLLMPADSFGFFNAVQNPLVRQAQEMQAMAIGMMQTATRLLSMQSTSPPHPFGLPNLQQPTFWAPPSQPPWRPRYHSRGHHPRRHFHYGGPWENGRRSPSGIRPLRPFSALKKLPEVIFVDSDEDDDELDDKSKVKREASPADDRGPNKRIKRGSDDVIILEPVTNGDLDVEMKPDVEIIEIKAEGSKRPTEVVEVDDVEIIDVDAVKTEAVNDLDAKVLKVEVVDLAGGSTSDVKMEVIDVDDVKTEKTEEEPNRTDIIDVDAKEAMRTGVVDVAAGEAGTEVGKGETERTTTTAVDRSDGGTTEEVENTTGEKAETTGEDGEMAGDKLVADRTAATNWSQFKLNYQLESQRVEQESESIEPIIRPIDCTGFGSVLSRLQIFGYFESLPEAAAEATADGSGISDPLKISYDVYLPSIHFKKSLKMLPNLRVIVVRADCEVPAPAEMGRLQRRYDDDIPFVFAVVAEDSVNFFRHESVRLPSLVAA